MFRLSHTTAYLDNICNNFGQNRLGNILGEFFANSSGHTGSKSPAPCFGWKKNFQKKIIAQTKKVLLNFRQSAVNVVNILRQ
jgi:hypothetical protein